MAVTDDFNRADSATLGANWQQQYGGGTGGSSGITSNKAGPPGNTSDIWGDYYIATSFDETQAGECDSVNDVNGFPAASSGGPSDRNSGDGTTATACGYYFSYSAGVYFLNKVVNGGETLLAFPVQNGANRDRLRLEASGSTLKMFKNGVQLGSDVSDAANASGAVGQVTFGLNAQVDNWQGESASGIAVGVLALAGMAGSLNYQINMPDEL